jgi:hypothetical protein
VCLLFGGDVPFMVREEEDGHSTLIGECYCHGIMHGEAINEAIRRGRESHEKYFLFH